MPTDRCEQEGRDQCGAKDVKKNHPGARKQKTETKARVQPSLSKVVLYQAGAVGRQNGDSDYERIGISMPDECYQCRQKSRYPLMRLGQIWG